MIGRRPRRLAGLLLALAILPIVACKARNPAATTATAQGSVAPIDWSEPLAPETLAVQALLREGGLARGELEGASAGGGLGLTADAPAETRCCACIYGAYDPDAKTFLRNCDRYADAHGCADDKRLAVAQNGHDWTVQSLDLMAGEIGTFAAEAQCTDLRIDQADHSWLSSQRPLVEICLASRSARTLRAVTVNDRGCGLFAAGAEQRFAIALRQRLERDGAAVGFSNVTVAGNQTYVGYQPAGSVATTVQLQYELDRGMVDVRVVYPACAELEGRRCTTHWLGEAWDGSQARCQDGDRQRWLYCCVERDRARWQPAPGCPIYRCDGFTKQPHCSPYAVRGGSGIPCWQAGEGPSVSPHPSHVVRCQRAIGPALPQWGIEPDGDGDAVADGFDWCPSTPAKARVYRGTGIDPRRLVGCAVGEVVSREPDGSDLPLGPPVSTPPDPNPFYADTDADGVPDVADVCQGTKRGARVEPTGPRAGCAPEQKLDRNVPLPGLPVRRR